MNNLNREVFVPTSVKATKKAQFIAGMESAIVFLVFVGIGIGLAYRG